MVSQTPSPRPAPQAKLVPRQLPVAGTALALELGHPHSQLEQRYHNPLRFVYFLGGLPFRFNLNQRYVSAELLFHRPQACSMRD